MELPELFDDEVWGCVAAEFFGVACPEFDGSGFCVFDHGVGIIVF